MSDWTPEPLEPHIERVVEEIRSLAEFQAKFGPMDAGAIITHDDLLRAVDSWPGVVGCRVEDPPMPGIVDLYVVGDPVGGSELMHDALTARMHASLALSITTVRAKGTSDP